MDASDELEERIRRLRHASEDAAINFVLSELTAGITSCKIVRLRVNKMGLDGSNALKSAKAALRVAEKYMWKLKMRHPEFDQMTAVAERLRLEIDALQPKKFRKSTRKS